MSCVNPNTPEFKEVLEEVGGNPLLAELEFDEIYPGKPSTDSKVVLDIELNSYISNQIANKFGISIPTKNNETLIPQSDVNKFKDTVAFNSGVFPSTFYSGPGDAHKCNLNEKNLYDLVDKLTGEIYLRDVNLNKGVQEYVELKETPINEKERSQMIDSINEGISDYGLDEILAEKGYDVQDFISNLEAATTQEELNKIINKILSKIC